MKVLLTGGAGYIGSHTAVELLNAGYEVVIADNFSNSSPETVGRIEKITGKNVSVYHVDVADKKGLRTVFEKERIGGVIHFAGYKAVGESVKVPLRYYRNNLDCTLTLLETMEQFGVNIIIFSSSATVYGPLNAIPYVETMAAGPCSNPYGSTKLMIEQIIKDASAARGELSAVLLRYFNPVGAHSSGLIGEMPNGIPNNLMPYISQVAVGKFEKLNVFGNDYPTRDGTGIRDYIHVVDLAKGHVAALKYGAAYRGVEVFNLGTGVGYSVLDIVGAFERANKIKIPYAIAPRREGDLPEYYSDSAKACRLMGWKAERTLEDMCRDAWNWQKNCPPARPIEV
ncbi:UDP-glucose 4-epimerase [Sporobacter termitidis DSM 10068]|uniref:UDP-glucose 4-epimerase n=1 Tax=Sporobacter termitidis DSM 10068 TaxID=1123282 RepID=A0A1M5YVI3_9FIRM|nr:UDP-glucose 4-epimerase GalE [Sporobacter termitidis]SHI15838.1 UDP-glucose 4-epimerase [Sporobacter termitidis DSM 10068]